MTSDEDRIRELDPAQDRLRTGRKVGRTIYLQAGEEPSDNDRLVGVMDTPELSERVVKAQDRIRELEAERDDALALLRKTREHRHDTR